MKKIVLPKSKKLKEKFNLNFKTDEEIICEYHIEFFSNKTVSVEGCKGIYEYNEDYIKINLKHGSFNIYGKNFEIINMTDNNITLSGTVISAEFAG